MYFLCEITSKKAPMIEPHPNAMIQGDWKLASGKIELIYYLYLLKFTFVFPTEQARHKLKHSAVFTFFTAILGSHTMAKN